MIWHVIVTQPRKEVLAAEFLRRRLGFEILFLHYWTKARHARYERTVIRPYFPRYLFLGLEAPQSAAEASTAWGVVGVLQIDGRPLSVPQAVMEELFTLGDDEGEVLVKPAEAARRERLRNGQAMRVDGGPFQGFMGHVDLDTGKQIWLWINEAGRRVRVGFPPESLSPVRRRNAKPALAVR